MKLILKLILFFKSRRKVIERYLKIKEENYILRERINRLEQQLALYKLQEIAARKKIPPQ